MSLLAESDELGPDWSRGSAIIPTWHALRTEPYLYVDATRLNSVPPRDHRTGELYWLPTTPPSSTTGTTRSRPTTGRP